MRVRAGRSGLMIGAALASGACGRVRFDPERDAAATDAAAGPAIVQSAGGQAALVTGLAITLPSTPVAGHLLVLVGGGQISGLSPPTGGAPVWTRASYSAVNPNVEIWSGVADGSSSMISFQAAGATAMAGWVSEWTGLAAAAPLDVAAAAAGSTSPASAGAIVTRAPTLLVFGVASFLPNDLGVPTDGAWTAVDTQDNGSSAQTVWIQLAPTPRMVAPTVTETRHLWDAALAAFRLDPTPP